MASSNKKVTLEVAIQTQEGQIDAVENKINKLKQQKLQMKFEADTQALDAASQKLKDAENKLAALKSARVDIDVNDAEIEEAEREVERLKQEQINLQLQVEEYKLDELQSKKDAIEADEINVQLNNQSAMQGLQQIADGFSRIKSSAMEVGQQFGDLLASAGKQETNFAFLKNAVGDAELARQKMSEINDIVAQLPGDDTALQGLLSSAAAKDSSLTADNLRSMANSATDYFSAMSYYGKSATEAQQDMTNYLLAGNTAELERSPILQGHIDKLKEATTVQERSKALAEALNEEHWGGMGAMDTYNNKLETFNGMIERGRYTLGGMFQEGAKDAMDFLLKLDESTNGLVGMGIAAASFASPITDMLIGVGQVGTGLKSLKEAADFTGITGKLKQLKSTLLDVSAKAKEAAISIGKTFWNALKSAATAAKDAALWIGRTSKELLTSAANALRSAAAWVWEKTVKVASTIATKAAAAAQAFLNLVMSMNPILLVVIAIVALIGVLWYLYNTNESVRAAIDGFIASLRGIAEEVYGTLVGAFQWLTDTWNGLVDAFNSGGQIISDTLGGAFQWLIDSFMGVVTFFQTYGPLIAQILFVMATGGIGAIVLLVANFMGMPNQVGAALQNVITRVVSWVANLVSQFTSGAQRAVNGFISPIRGLVDKVAAELSAVYNTVMRFIQPLIDAFNSLGSAAAWAFSVLGLGQGSPGDIYRAIKNELGWTTDFVKSDATGLVGSTAQLGKDVVKGWGNPTFGYSFDGTANIEGNLSGTNLSEVIRLLSELLDAMRGGDNNGNINNTFNLYGDMDDDKRMEKFLNAVRKELAWNNKTAGRTV